MAEDQPTQQPPQIDEDRVNELVGDVSSWMSGDDQKKLHELARRAAEGNYQMRAAGVEVARRSAATAEDEANMLEAYARIYATSVIQQMQAMASEELAVN
jgi:hypothetical protein